MNVAVIGLGLLGGSFALALKKRLEDTRVLGVDTNPDHCSEALKKGIADEIADLEDAISKADLVVVATPVDAIVEQVSEILDLLPDGAIAVDFGSTKDRICQSASRSSKRGRFVALHPIAGTEDSGPKAAFSELLPGKMMIVCDSDKSDPDALNTVVDLFKKLDMEIEYMSSVAHDMHIAYVSHLSHISSFALGATVLEKEKNENNIFIMAGSGFSSTVRLAKSSPDMWAPIFGQNRKNLSEAVGNYIEKLQRLKDMIDNDDRESLHNFMNDTNDIRRVLKGD